MTYIKQLENMSKNKDGESWRNEPRASHYSDDQLEKIIEESSHLNSKIAARFRIMLNEIQAQNGAISLEEISGNLNATPMSLSIMIRPSDEFSPAHLYRSKLTVAHLYRMYECEYFNLSQVLYVVTGHKKTDRELRLEKDLTSIREELKETKAILKKLGQKLTE